MNHNHNYRLQQPHTTAGNPAGQFSKSTNDFDAASIARARPSPYNEHQNVFVELTHQSSRFSPVHGLLTLIRTSPKIGASVKFLTIKLAPGFSEALTGQQLEMSIILPDLTCLETLVLMGSGNTEVYWNPNLWRGLQIIVASPTITQLSLEDIKFGYNRHYTNLLGKRYAPLPLLKLSHATLIFPAVQVDGFSASELLVEDCDFMELANLFTASRGSSIKTLTVDDIGGKGCGTFLALVGHNVETLSIGEGTYSVLAEQSDSLKPVNLLAFANIQRIAVLSNGLGLLKLLNTLGNLPYLETLAIEFVGASLLRDGRLEILDALGTYAFRALKEVIVSTNVLLPSHPFITLRKRLPTLIARRLLCFSYGDQVYDTQAIIHVSQALPSAWYGGYKTDMLPVYANHGLTFSNLLSSPSHPCAWLGPALQPAPPVPIKKDIVKVKKDASKQLPASLKRAIVKALEQYRQPLVTINPGTPVSYPTMRFPLPPALAPPVAIKDHTFSS